MTPEETRALIAKARDMAAASYGGTSRTLRDLADALEAAEARIDSLDFELTGVRLMARKDNEHLIARAEAAEALFPVPDGDARERLADWLGDRPEAYNVRDITDEATTVIQIAVEDLARDLLAAFPVLGAAAPETEWETTLVWPMAFRIDIAEEPFSPDLRSALEHYGYDPSLADRADSVTDIAGGPGADYRAAPRLVRRRKAGPWEPVGGESDGE